MSVASETHPLVGILMGADSDWPVMQVAARISDEPGVPYEARVVSARRTPERCSTMPRYRNPRGG